MKVYNVKYLLPKNLKLYGLNNTKLRHFKRKHKTTLYSIGNKANLSKI